ncbi:histidine phosphatase family protein [Candidatus Roizmanbacteria bacterium]|nr:histidine phosphatase family protein [Candidatus Roizmanbacteria bacterium]
MHAENRKILRGTDAVIDTVFIRHAQREAITPKMLALKKSPSLTPEGISRAKEWGAQTLRSDQFFLGKYDQIVFTASAIPRTHQTAVAIRDGVKSDRSSLMLFSKIKGSKYDKILRERPDGRQWNKAKIESAAKKILSPDSQFSLQISNECNALQNKIDPEKVIQEALKILNSDISTLSAYLSIHLLPEIASRLAHDIVVALYDGFMDEEEVDLYMAHPMNYLLNLSRSVLKRRPSNTRFLNVGVTHDFNIAGMLKGMCGIKSFFEVGGAPDFLSYLHIRMGLDGKGAKSTKVFYNGQELVLLPTIENLFHLDEK